MATSAIRIKSQWFKPGTPKTPEQQAGAMGFTLWRVARQSLDRMRQAGFDIDAGLPYFAFLREMLVFLIVVVDRLAYQRLDAADRAAFTTALVRHVAGTLEGNEIDLMGEPPAGQPRPADRLIDLYNDTADLYAGFGAAAAADEFAPGLDMMRCLATRLEPAMPAKDRHWILDQVVAIQVPDAVALLQRTMRELHSNEPRRARRAALSGD